jgi:hypothetical protein
MTPHEIERLAQVINDTADYLSKIKALARAIQDANERTDASAITDLADLIEVEAATAESRLERFYAGMVQELANEYGKE